MEAKETGLSLEEKIMFSILGVVLIIAIGVLIINGFSNSERRLVEETPVKNVEQSEENKTTDTKNEEPLKESETITVVSNNTTHKKVTYLSQNKTEDKKEESKQTTWVVNKNIVTEAYSGDIIAIDDTVIDSNKKVSHAAVTVRKLENDAYNIVEVTDNRFVATEGIYVYYYTHDSVTKEVLLKVYEKVAETSLSITELTDEETYYLEEDEFSSLKENNENTTLELLENYTLTLTKKSEYSKVALTLKTDFIVYSFEMDTKGIQVLDIKTDEETNASTITILVDTSILEGTQEIRLTMNDKLYSLTLDIAVKEYEGTEEDKEDEGEEQEEQNGENEEKEDEGKMTDPEEQPGDDLEPSEVEETAQDTNISETIEESVTDQNVTDIETSQQVLA